MPGSFFDTNVVVYLASSDAQRAERAESIISRGGTISVQVLNELTNVCRRKMRLSWNDIRTFLSLLRGFLVINLITLEVHERALTLAEGHRLSIYDAMIVASALDAGCDVLWSEDMQDGMRIEKKLRIVNPFEHSEPE